MANRPAASSGGDIYTNFPVLRLISAMREPSDLKLGTLMQEPLKGNKNRLDLGIFAAILKKKKKTVFGGSDFGAILAPEVRLASRVWDRKCKIQLFYSDLRAKDPVWLTYFYPKT